VFFANNFYNDANVCDDVQYAKFDDCGLHKVHLHLYNLLLFVFAFFTNKFCYYRVVVVVIVIPSNSIVVGVTVDDVIDVADDADAADVGEVVDVVAVVCCC
jgi:hypothetical protein